LSLDALEVNNLKYKQMKTKLISFAIVILLIVGIVWKLKANKSEIQEEAKLSQLTSTSIPVVAAKLSIHDINNQIIVPGKLEPFHQIDVVAEAEGKIVKVYKEKGDKVVKGELLVKIDDEVLSANLLTAEANFTKAEKDLVRFNSLASGNAITERQLEDAKLMYNNAKAKLITARKNLNNTNVEAPISGIINNDFVDQGQFLRRNSVVYDLVDINKFKLNVKVSEFDVLQLNSGQQIEITTDVYPGQIFTGTISSIAVSADQSLKYNVEVVMENSDTNPLRAGMYANVSFNKGEIRQGYLLDRNAIVNSVKNPSVFVIENGVAKLKSIKIGITIGDKVEVISGIDANTTVILSGQINLKEGTKVTVI